MPQLILETLNLQAAERRLCVTALEHAGNIVGAAKLLGITRHAMKRRIIKLQIDHQRGHVTDAVHSESPAVAAA